MPNRSYAILRGRAVRERSFTRSWRVVRYLFARQWREAARQPYP